MNPAADPPIPLPGLASGTVRDRGVGSPLLLGARDVRAGEDVAVSPCGAERTFGFGAVTGGSGEAWRGV
jgi:hypothetical protein